MAQCQCLENNYDQWNNEQNMNGPHTFWSLAECIEPNYEVQSMGTGQARKNYKCWSKVELPVVEVECRDDCVKTTMDEWHWGGDNDAAMEGSEGELETGLVSTFLSESTN